MKNTDIMEVFIASIEEKILKEWRHDGFIGGFTSDSGNFCIDGKEYVLKMIEIKDGNILVRRREMTNADMIRAMSDEELAANLMCPNEMGMADIPCDKSDQCDCYKCLLDWLRKPAVEE